MLWRCRWSFTRTKHGKQTLNELQFFIHTISAPLVRPTGKTTENFQENFIQCFPRGRKVVLIPEIVHSILLGSSSDLIALRFFLWCAKQHNYVHTAQEYAYMIGVLKNLTVHYKTVKEIIRGLVSIGCVIKAQTFLLLLRIFSRGRMYEMVFEAFEEMITYGLVPNTFARNIIMDVLYKTRRVDLAIKVLKETKSPDSVSFDMALCNLCKFSDLITIKDVISIMLRKGLYPNDKTLKLVLNCFCKMGRLSEAYQILALMTSLGIYVSMHIWTILINGFCGVRQPWIAGDLLKKMVNTGCSPDVVTYTTLIKGFLEARMVSNAFSVLNAMTSTCCGPDLVLCNVLIDCLSKIGRYDDALDVYLSLSDRNLVPSSYTLSSLLSNIILSRRFNLLPNFGRGLLIEADFVVYNSLINYYNKATLPSFALELYNVMVDRGFTPNNYSFSGLLCAICKTGRVDEAVNVYEGMLMSCSGLNAHVHTIIIDELIRVGKYRKAIRLFRRAILENFPLNVVSYTVAMRGLVQTGRMEEALGLYNQMKEVGIFPNAFTYDIMLSGFVKNKNVKVVKRLLGEISKESSIRMQFSTLRSVTDFLLKFESDSSTINQLNAMWNRGLEFELDYDKAMAISSSLPEI